MTRDIQSEILAAMGDGDDNPDPEGKATALCAYCDFPIYETRVHTGRQFRGPFWQDAWVHTDTERTDCWHTHARPDKVPA